MSNRNYYGAYLPTTAVLDVGQVYSTEVTSPAFKELIVRLYQTLNQIALITNIKDTGMYILDEFVTGQQYFADPSLTSLSAQQPALRPVFRKVINFGALPNTATKSVAHGITITAATTFTRIYGCSTQPNTSYIPLPYASSVLANNIELYVDPVNVNITTAANWTVYTITYIVLEYMMV